MHRQDFTPVSTHSMMRTKFDEIGMHMEEKMGKKFFICDAVLDSVSRQIAIFSGWGKEMQPISWEVADKRTYVPWAKKKYDIVVFGMPQKFHYGDGMGTNPIQMMQALSAQVIRHKRIMSDRCVFICSSVCDGFFNDDRWPYAREQYELFQREGSILPEIAKYGGPVRRAAGLYRKVPFPRRVPPIPRLFHDELRAYRGGELERDVHRGREGAGLCPRHGHEDARDLRGSAGGCKKKVYGRQPEHPCAAQDVCQERGAFEHGVKPSRTLVERSKNLSPTAIIIVVAICFAGSIVQTWSGFGFSIVVMSVFSLMMPSYGEATALSNLLMLGVSIYLALRMRGFIRWKLLLWPLIAYVPLSYLAVRFVAVEPGGTLQILLGITLIVLGVWFFFFKNKVYIKQTPVAGLITGAVSGTMGGLFCMAGVPLAVYLIGIKEKESYLATIGMLYVLLTAYSAALHASNGFITTTVLWMVLYCAGAVVVGTLLGQLIFKRVKQEILTKAVYDFMLVSGAFLLLT